MTEYKIDLNPVAEAKTRFKVSLYNTVGQDVYVDAVDEDDAINQAFINMHRLNEELPEGFSMWDDSAWELDDVEEVVND